MRFWIGIDFGFLDSYAESLFFIDKATGKQLDSLAEIVGIELSELERRTEMETDPVPPKGGKNE